MALQPSRNIETIVSGQFEFRASGYDHETEDAFDLEIKVTDKFPNDIPKVREIGGKIPRTGDFHVNPDTTLCLGSQLRLKKLLHESPNLVSFAEQCIVPYLFNVSIKLKNGGDFVTGELAHGTIGIVYDYIEIFGLKTLDQTVYALKLLGAKKRIANKKICPCGCGIALGRCNIHHRINSYRPIAPRSWFRQHAHDIEKSAFG